MLKKGGQLLLKGEDGDALTVQIEDIRTETKVLTTYNLTVANAHTYFVGQDAVLVHNAKKCGVIYRVDGSKTKSGKPYVGSANDLEKRAKGARDGRDRTDAEIVDTYPLGDRNARRAAEQRAIDNNRGVDALDNKRNEVADSKRQDKGLGPNPN